MSGCIRTTSTRCSKQTRREKQQEWVFLCSNLYISVFFLISQLTHCEWKSQTVCRISRPVQCFCLSTGHTTIQTCGDGDLDAAAHVRFTSSNPPDSIDKNSHFSSQTSISQSVWNVGVWTFSLSVQYYRPDWDESNNDVSIFVLLLFKCTSYFSSVSFTSQLSDQTLNHAVSRTHIMGNKHTSSCVSSA